MRARSDAFRRFGLAFLSLFVFAFWTGPVPNDNAKAAGKTPVDLALVLVGLTTLLLQFLLLIPVVLAVVLVRLLLVVVDKRLTQ